MGTELLADMDAIVAQEFDHFEIELSKAITAALSKGGLQYLATDTVRAENDLTLLLSVSVRHSRSVDYPCGFTTGALCKQIRFCKIPTPKDQLLTLAGTGTKLSTEVTLPSKHTNLVWVRSISAFTPLRVVGICSLSHK